MNNKQSIAWHKECLKSSREYEERERQAALRRMQEVARTHERNVFHEQQIAEAERRGLTEFDGERFMIKRKN